MPQAFQPMSMRDAIAGGTRLATTQLAIQDYKQKREDQKTIRDLTAGATEGQEGAMKQLMGYSPEQAATLINAMNGMDARDKALRQAQNEEVAKAVIMAQGAPENQRAQIWDSNMTFLADKMGIEQAREAVGNYSPQLAQQYLTQTMTLSELMKDSEEYELKVGLSEDGQTAGYYHVPKKPGGTARRVPGVKPTEKDTQYKPTKGGDGGKELKSADSNSIARAIADELSISFTRMADGSIKYNFKTQDDSKKATEIAARAEQIWLNDPQIGHRGAVKQARTELEGQAGPMSAKDWLQQDLKRNK